MSCLQSHRTELRRKHLFPSSRVAEERKKGCREARLRAEEWQTAGEPAGGKTRMWENPLLSEAKRIPGNPLLVRSRIPRTVPARTSRLFAVDHRIVHVPRYGLYPPVGPASVPVSKRIGCGDPGRDPGKPNQSRKTATDAVNCKHRIPNAKWLPGYVYGRPGLECKRATWSIIDGHKIQHSGDTICAGSLAGITQVQVVKAWSDACRTGALYRSSHLLRRYFGSHRSLC